MNGGSRSNIIELFVGKKKYNIDKWRKTLDGAIFQGGDAWNSIIYFQSNILNVHKLKAFTAAAAHSQFINQKNDLNDVARQQTQRSRIKNIIISFLLPFFDFSEDILSERPNFHTLEIVKELKMKWNRKGVCASSASHAPFFFFILHFTEISV